MTTTALPLAARSVASVGAPRVVPLLEKRITRVRRHRAAMSVIDLAMITLAASATAALTAPSTLGVARTLLSPAIFALAASWAIALILLRDRAYRRGLGERLQLLPILNSAAIGAATLAIASDLFGWDALRAHVAITVPLGVALLVGLRAARRIAANHRPAPHTLAPRTLVVGSRAGVTHTIASLQMESRFGHDIVGVALSDVGTDGFEVGGVPFTHLGSPQQAADLARTHTVETVIVTDGIDDPDYLRRLSWSLEGAAIDLALATRLTDVDRSRIAFDRAHGLALTRIALPRFDESTMRTKRALDIVVAIAALVPIALLTPFLAAAIALDSPGGIFFRQRRIGRDGREFDILKFRTMGVDAEARRAELVTENEGAGPLFKMKNDPRVTRVGAVLRRFSLDELPQFWNVLVGEMSVVGPRPPLPTEVADYDHDVFRRLYVQPGITGLWQVSGRSDLTWEQSVRLDLNYVENWSVLTDLKIMLKTAAVMVRPKGAY